MICKIAIFFLILVIMPCFGMKKNIETTDTVQNTAIRWSFELYNKSNYAATVLIGNKITGNSLVIEYLATVPPMKKVRTTINRAFPLVVEIQKNGQKITEAFVMPCLPNRRCVRTVFLTLDADGLRPETGQWYGIKGVTDSELDITQNIGWEQISHDWGNFIARNKHLFQNKTYSPGQGEKQDQSMYQKAKETVQGGYDATKEKLGELFYGKPLSQEQIAQEVVKSKNLISKEADVLINMANKNEESSFKKETALAILNKLKRESIIELDQVQSINEIKAIYDNFQNKIARTKHEIHIANEKTKFKSNIRNRADFLIDEANKIESPSFKKMTALAIINKWKKQSMVDIDQAQTTEDMVNIEVNFDSKTENTRLAIEEAKKK